MPDKYTVSHDPAEPEYKFDVLDADLDPVYSFATREEAEAYAAERNDEAEAERLRDDIYDVLDDLDIDTLREMHALVRPGGGEGDTTQYISGEGQPR